ncbi:hypothetical protein D3C76_1357240 [compost metagenome]
MVFVLGDEGADAGIQAAPYIKVGGLAGQHHDLGHRLEALKPLDHLHAVQAGQADVQKHHVRPQFTRHLGDFAAIGDFADDVKALPFEQ